MKRPIRYKKSKKSPSRNRSGIKNQFEPWKTFGMTEAEYYAVQFIKQRMKLQEVAIMLYAKDKKGLAEFVQEWGIDNYMVARWREGKRK